MKATTITAEQAIEADERRARRDSHVAQGGSKKRPLKSFMTTAEKKEARQDHAARIHAAVEALEDASGVAAWLEALDLNPQLSAMNAALVALQTPGEIVGSVASWKRGGYSIRKGEHAAGRLTAPGFWPLAYFTAEQARAGDLSMFDPPVPPTATVEAIRAELAALLSEGERARIVLDTVAKRYREGD